ncbi:hypothetical protein EFE42_00140 [Methanohalophilus sp. RSK]|uniref:hypothetical protein n=1 Tax=Methanohalophilus sp. RSK TaxID=2485783 RepID=UPI000F43C610|nr:hypothetical protein [Methanohalophilus sp. RSK]RNI15695.1 hypothetical protein EFE42_00140 [Methanohalophilus sp. RSK]
MGVLTFALIFVIIFSGLTSAKVISVNDGGDSDYLKIENAVKKANVGDTILVYNGTYVENININKELTVTSFSENADDCIVRAEDPINNVFNIT